MLNPDYLGTLPDTLVELYSQAEQDILADMARRIRTYDYWIPAAEHQYQKMIEMGYCHESILQELSRRTGKTRTELEQLMTQAGNKALHADLSVYRKAGLVKAYTASESMNRILNEGIESTAGLFSNLTATTAQTGSQQFVNALDRAWMQIQTGGFDYNTAIRNAVKSLCKQGVGSVSYASGRTDHLEVAVRRAVVTGVNQTALKMQCQLADELGCDLVETTAHAGARPSHAEWQGKIFSRSGKHPKYPDFVKSTGYGTGPGLGGWNCRHSFYPYVEGSARAYSQEMLEEYDAKNIEYNGQKMTEYEASQKQRYIERQIRRWKRENVAMKAAGQDTAESAVKICSWQEIQKDFVKQTGLKRQSAREQIGSYGRSEARKTVAEGRKYGIITMQGQFSYVQDGEKLFIPASTDISNRKVIAGKGSATPIRVESKLVKMYGGKNGEWSKCVGKIESAKYIFDMHWYERNGKQYEMKIKFRREQKQ